jgi:cell division protein FtsI (penicillin-binding protein 3)
MPDKNKIENKKIQRNYFIVALFLALVIVSIVARAVVTSFVERDKWKNIGLRYVPFRDTIPAPRGDIYSSDGKLLAASETNYQLYMDFWADGVKESVLRDNIKPLSVELNKMFPEKSASQYEANILNGLKMKQKEEQRIKSGEEDVAKRSTSYPLIIPVVNDLQYGKIKQMPFFNQGRNKSGLYEKKLIKRIKPFGILASRTIGDIWNGVDSVGGRYGLEKAYDYLLEGKPGVSIHRWVEGRFKEDPETDPVPGKDIVSTIDVNFQDITENALMNKLQELNAESGTAVVMEVKTGEIKAIANLGRSGDGAWNEYLNYALSDMSEPGSTFKVASMMVALEDSIVRPNDPIDVGNGRFNYDGTPLLDHNADHGGYGKINVAKVIWFSSNIGMAKIILKGFEKNPTKYVDGLYREGINKDLKIEIPDYIRARIRYPNDSTRRWYKTTLPWMAFGYETQIPPIQTLTFFNAIANNGTMMKPMFVEEIRNERGGGDKKKPVVLQEHICSDNTLKIIHEMLDSVVNNPHGTGKPAHSNLVQIAGKTGTAQISQGAAGYKAGGKSYQVSFCGYFPADAPKYSCIVVVRRPRVGSAGGGTMCGTVFKQIAEAVTALNDVEKPINLSKEKATPEIPKVKNGIAEQSKYVLNKLDIRYADSLKGNWANAQWNDNRLVLKGQQLTKNSVPNVVGMGAKDAVYALENTGLRVNLLGQGEVYSQSLGVGTTAMRGQTITIQLK